MIEYDYSMDNAANEWTNTKEALKELDNSLGCPICSRILEEPCGLGNCDHTFCRACVGNHLGNTCPLCSAPAWVKDLKTNRQLTNVVHLSKKLRKIIEGKYTRNDESQTEVDVAVNNEEEDSSTKESDDDEEERGMDVGSRHKTSPKFEDSKRNRKRRNVTECVKYQEESEEEEEEGDQFTPDDDEENDEDFDPGVAKKQKVSKRQALKQKKMMVVSQNHKRKIETKFSPRASILRYTVNLRTRRVKTPSPRTRNTTRTTRSSSKSTSETASTSGEDAKQNAENALDDVFDFVASPTGSRPTTRISHRNSKTSLKKKITSYNKQWGLKNGRSRRKAAVKTASESRSASDTETERKVSFLEIDESDTKQHSDEEKDKTENKKNTRGKKGIVKNGGKEDERSSSVESSSSGRKRRTTDKTTNDERSPDKKSKPSISEGQTRRDQQKRQTSEITPTKREAGFRGEKFSSPSTVQSPLISSSTVTPRPSSRRASGGIVNSPHGSLTKKNMKGETPLHRASIKGEVYTVKTLLEAGADPNTKDFAGWTPLHEACNHGYLEIVRLLLDNGALINVPGLENDSPLHDAVSNNRIEVVCLLVQRGASLETRNIHGLTPRDLAVTADMKNALNTVPVVTQTQQNSSQKMEQLIRAQVTEVVMIGTALKREQKVKLEQCAKLLKGRVVEEFDGSVTHVVTSCNADGQCARTMKLLQGILHGKWIVSYDWVKRCLEKKQHEEEQYFEVTGTCIHPFTLGPRKARQNSEQKCPGLFSGCYFYFHGSFSAPTPSKAELADLVKAGEGTVLLREPKSDDCNQPGGTVPYHAQTNSNQSECTHYIIYDHFSKKQPGKIKTPKLCTASSSWLTDCISQFTILELSD